MHLIALTLLLPLSFISVIPSVGQIPIDREEVVTRHSVHIRAFQPLDSLSVGNGGFAFTVDPTGLQSFPEYYESGVCLGTQSDWGWHSLPNVENFTRDETLKDYQAGSRTIPIAVQKLDTERGRAAAEYFRQNPHRLHLGHFGMQWLLSDGSPATIEDIRSIHQTLDLWTGEIHSCYYIDGEEVRVTTICDPDSDSIAFQIQSLLISRNRLRLKLSLPYPSLSHTDSGAAYSIKTENKHHSEIARDTPLEKQWVHRLDDTQYSIELSSSVPLQIIPQGNHAYVLCRANVESDTDSIKGILSFSPTPWHDAASKAPSFQAIRQRNADSWLSYWNKGGIVDFAGSTDPRAEELERRIVLSQYLERIQCAGNYPPQETGLTFNSWYGKFHMEMHWWHAVHWALWNHPEYLEKSLEYYDQILNAARNKAKQQSFNGARWPKMTDPSGGDSPSDIGEFLIWQQPHLIYLVNLLYRLNPTQEILNRYTDLISATADFMVDLPVKDTETGAYHLSSPLIPAQERLPKLTTVNPAFELRYWKWALQIADDWTRHYGKSDPTYKEIANHMPGLPSKDGLYLAATSAPDSYQNPDYMGDHPMVLGAIGMLPLDDTVDLEIAKATFEFIKSHWDWSSTWGWDYPMMAMAATRLGMPEEAVDALLMEVQKNTYLANGHNYQDERLRIYLPGNGGLLTAVAMMCAGYSGNTTENPGFPRNGWQIRWENLQSMP